MVPGATGTPAIVTSLVLTNGAVANKLNANTGPSPLARKPFDDASIATPVVVCCEKMLSISVGPALLLIATPKLLLWNVLFSTCTDGTGLPAPAKPRIDSAVPKLPTNTLFTIDAPGSSRWPPGGTAPGSTLMPNVRFAANKLSRTSKRPCG